MRTMTIGLCERASVIAAGCWRMNAVPADRAAEWLAAALDAGINFFDHADIYGGGSCEDIFGAAMAALGVPRDRVYLQSKCGIRPRMYDFSKEHILEAVEGSLRRLRTDYIDLYQLHWPARNQPLFGQLPFDPARERESTPIR
ncbi:MAG: aldo/keto reductase, partial [Clostridiales bacterium]|nr:aldo/keto reductase [Clostridiales bacterium]